MYALLELCYTKKRKFGVMIATTLVSLCYHSWTNTLDLMRIKCSVCEFQCLVSPENSFCNVVQWECMTMFIGMAEFFLDAKFTLSLCRNLRQRDATKYHIQLCIALFCMLIVFVSGIDETGVYAGCLLVSVLIHYLTLVFVMWMGAEALLMFRKLVIVFVHITTRYIVVTSFVCWCK